MAARFDIYPPSLKWVWRAPCTAPVSVSSSSAHQCLVDMTLGASSCDYVLDVWEKYVRPFRIWSNMALQ